MKKILLGTCILLAFNAAIIITQMSCKKEAQAQTPGNTAINKLIFIKTLNGNDPQNAKSEVWITDLKGGNAQQVRINLPDNLQPVHAAIGPNYRVYISCLTKGSNGASGALYSCEADGADPQKLQEGDTMTGVITLEGAY